MADFNVIRRSFTLHYCDTINGERDTLAEAKALAFDLCAEHEVSPRDFTIDEVELGLNEGEHRVTRVFPAEASP